MNKSQNIKLLLFTLFSVTVVVSNVISAKILWTPLSLFDIPVVLPGSAFVYLLTFFFNGMINELWGKDTAKQCVKFGLISQITALILFFLTGLLPPNDYQFQNAYQMVLGRNFVFVVSDIVAGFTAQFIHTCLYPLIKKHNFKNNGLTNCVSILLSQILDTVVFMVCAFGIGLGYLFTYSGRLSLLTMVVGQYSIKIIVCIVSIPIFTLISSRLSTSITERSEDSV